METEAYIKQYRLCHYKHYCDVMGHLILGERCSGTKLWLMVTVQGSQSRDESSYSCGHLNVTTVLEQWTDSGMAAG